jgi:hypothetical protein
MMEDDTQAYMLHVVHDFSMNNEMHFLITESEHISTQYTLCRELHLQKCPFS